MVYGYDVCLLFGFCWWVVMTACDLWLVVFWCLIVSVCILIWVMVSVYLVALVTLVRGACG